MDELVAIVHFEGEINHLAKLCVDIKDRLKSFKKPTSVLQNVPW